MKNVDSCPGQPKEQIKKYKECNQQCNVNFDTPETTINSKVYKGPNVKVDYSTQNACDFMSYKPIPGYAGHIPKMVNKFGGTYSNLAKECIEELNSDCEIYNMEQSQLNLETTIFPQLRSTADWNSVKEHMKEWCDDYLGKNRVNYAIRGPLDPPLSGYEGHIPKAGVSDLACGHTFHEGSKKCLSAFRTENLDHFARLKTPVDPSSINSKDFRRLDNDVNGDPCSSRIFRKTGMIPHYAGHIHGQDFEFGKTMGESTRNLEVCNHYYPSYSQYVKNKHLEIEPSPRCDK